MSNGSLRRGKLIEPKSFPEAAEQEFTLTDDIERALEREFRRLTGDADPSDGAVEEERKRFTRVALGTDMCGIDAEEHAAALKVDVEKVTAFIAEAARLFLDQYHLQPNTAYDTAIQDGRSALLALKEKSDLKAVWADDHGSLYSRAKTAIEGLPKPTFDEQQNALDELSDAVGVMQRALSRFSCAIEKMPRPQRGRPSAHLRDVVVAEFCAQFPRPKYHSFGSRQGERDEVNAGAGPKLLHDILCKVAKVDCKLATIIEAIKKQRSGQ